MTAYLAVREQAGLLGRSNHFGSAALAFQRLDPRQGKLMVQIARDIIPGVNVIMQQGNIPAIESRYGISGAAMPPGSY